MTEDEVFDDMGDFGYYFDTETDLYITNACHKMNDDHHSDDEGNPDDKKRKSKIYEIMTRVIRKEIHKIEMRSYLVHAFYLISISILSYKLWQSNIVKAERAQ